jgi:hypothetical protein
MGPQKKLVSPQYHVMFDDNFDTVQAPDLNVKHIETMDRLFKTKSYTYDDPFGNEQMYSLSYWGVDVHPDNLTPNIKTCQESLVMISTYDDHHFTTQTKASTEKTHNNKSICSMKDLVILHANNIVPQNNKYDFKSYKQLHGIDMQIHSITKPPKQKAKDMGLSDLYEEEFKLIAMEYNTTNTEPDNELDHYVNTLQWSNEDYDPGINDMFLNNLDPTFYAMQMQNSDVLTHAQIKDK